ncbi:LOW QUALITY PROTEIN: bone marrow proteoglycan [Physeter macrocephalus]|uniref:LOW QUALITY PROTEIN: bone marrow proteoglycan n=1 Tax=Physeter macrocephalus TaxID=9755 RepID=A0A2Y9FUX8_PHYMC|nr:LOW QUALITY PROTEIN: bone marrow proteoglycan [Physeter catodon]|eukprot:XP_007131260.1 LOW QUALITY PROTEIN: bone marrow proteoglycan [Physeter catodon]
MKLPLLLALLLGTVSAFHLRTERSNIESPLGDDTLPQVGEVSESEAKEVPVEEQMLLEEEEDRGSGSEDAPRKKGAVEPISALDEVDRDLQCPKDEDTVKLEGIPGCKTCRFLLLTCQRCYRGRLISIHNFSLNYQIQCLVRQINQGQVWIGGQVTSWGRCTRFCWLDGTPWNFAHGAAGQLWGSAGRCVHPNDGGILAHSYEFSPVLGALEDALGTELPLLALMHFEFCGIPSVPYVITQYTEQELKQL